MLKQYLVEIKLPPHFTQVMISIIPAQRKYINKLLDAGVLLTYSLAADRSKLWTVVLARTTAEVTQVLAKFPMIEYMTPIIHQLAFHNQVSLLSHEISLN